MGRDYLRGALGFPTTGTFERLFALAFTLGALLAELSEHVQPRASPSTHYVWSYTDISQCTLSIFIRYIRDIFPAIDNDRQRPTMIDKPSRNFAS